MSEIRNVFQHLLSEFEVSVVISLNAFFEVIENGRKVLLNLVEIVNTDS